MPRTMKLWTTAAWTLVLLTALGLAYPAPALAKTEIHFWHAMTGQLGDAVNELVKQFNESQNEYEVKPLRKGTYPETLTAAIAAYRQKNPPHIVQVFEVGTQTMMLSGAVLPVYQLMKEQEIKIDWKDFIAPVVGYYSKDGNLYSMPFNSSTPILYYNKDAFAEGRARSGQAAADLEAGRGVQRRSSSARAPPSAASPRAGRPGPWSRTCTPGTISRSRPSATGSTASTPSS